MDNNQPVRGAVYVEFLIVVIPLIILFFSLVQLGLALSAGILTTLAAQTAARSAMVVLPDDHEEASYREPLLQVGNGEAGVEAYRDAGDESRYETIRYAARVPLAPVSPSLESLGATSMEAALSQGDALNLAVGLGGWTRVAVGLGFINGEDEFIATFSPDSPVRVHVAYLFPCLVPIGNTLACKSYGDLDATERKLIEVNGKGLSLARFTGWRFLLLKAEAPVPIWDR